MSWYLFAKMYYYRFATPGGRRGLQACGLWVRSVFFVRTTVPMLNINEKTASDLADTADRADATDITVFCYIVFFCRVWRSSTCAQYQCDTCHFSNHF